MNKFLGGVLQGNETVFLTQDEINNPYADIPTMIEDKKRKQVQMKQTIFHRITASPEVLAEDFVEPYTRWGEDGHLETLWRTNFRELSGMLFDTKEEAIAATVAKLKEVLG